MQDHDYLTKDRFKKLRRTKESLTMTGVWLRRIGDQVEVLVEKVDADGERRWYKAISEHYDGNFSHISEPEGAENWSAVDFGGGPNSTVEYPNG